MRARWLFAAAVVGLGCVVAAAVVLTHGSNGSTNASRPASGATSTALTTYNGDLVRFSYPADWFRGGDVDQHGQGVTWAGMTSNLTHLSDRPFEPLCSADAGTVSCSDPPMTGRRVWIEWYSAAGVDEFFLPQTLTQPHRFGERTGSWYQGQPTGSCADLGATYEIAVAVPDVATLPSTDGIAMTACFSGADQAALTQQVTAMISSLTFPRMSVSAGLNGRELCEGVLQEHIESAGLVTVGWVRSFSPGGPPGAGPPAAHAFPGSPATDVAAWCWTGTSKTWTFSVVDVSGDQLGLGGLTGVALPPTRPLVEK
jgi:hypothetical protein